MKKGLFLAIALTMVFVLVFSGCGGKKEITSVPEELKAEKTILEKDKYYPPHSKAGPAVEKIEFGSFHVDQAAADLLADKMDIYLFGLKIAAAKELKKKGGLKVFRSPASSISILLNPAPAAQEGKLNPFSLPEVRKAMNYLVDRGFVVQDIYGGLAVPQVSLVSPLDYDYLTVYDIIEKRRIAYDFEYAKSLVQNAMRKAGAELVNGKWHYQGKLVRLKFIIRTEDERREAGDTIRVALEKVGFQVDAAYKTFAAAIFTVYTSDPQVFEWHLYTEGWGRGGAEKYDFANINQFAAPWMANLPGWQIAGFWQYQNKEIDRLGKKLFTGDFSSKEERDEIYREMLNLSLDDSIRIWVATVYNIFPAKEKLLGATEDLVAGPKGILTLREAFLPGKDSLRAGNLWVWTERSVFNPIGGFEDVYSIDIYKNLVDPPMINHPFSGLPMAFRAQYQVETAGPRGKLDVPQSAVIWDAEKDKWQEAPLGAKATSKVIFDYSKYFQSAWHHGKRITMADVIYGIYQSFERTYDPEKRQIEFVLAAIQKPLLDTFRGIRVIDENRLEVYLDFWHFEADYIASYASLSGLPLPWEVMAAMDKLVFEDRMAAYSKTASAKFNVPWLSLVMTKDAAMVVRNLKEFQAKTFLPENIFTIGAKNLISLDESKMRYLASLDWFEKYGHLVISQGPFFLVRYDPPAQYAELRAFRDKNYPFKPGDWYFGKPQPLELVKIDAASLVAGQEGLVEIELRGPGRLSLDYFIDGKVGQAKGVSPNKFQILINEQLTKKFAGKYFKVSLLISSSELSLIKEEQIDIQVGR